MGIAIITGGSTGLGAALCEEYLARDWQVVEFSRRAPHPYSVKLDLADLHQAARVFGATFESLASHACDEVVAINNAAVLGPVGPSAFADPTEVARSVDVNVTAGVLFASEFIRVFQLRECAKTFVNISSGAAVKAHPGWSLYSAGKAAMEHYGRVLAAEQDQHDSPVRVFSVNPGIMDTGMQAEVRSAKPEDFPELDRFIGYRDDGLLVPPRDVATRIADLVAARPESGATYSAGG